MFEYRNILSTKLTSQVSLVTALIEQDHFLYLSSFMDKYFSGNVFIFLIFKRDWIERAYTSTQNQVCLCSLYAILLGDDFDTVDIFFFSGPI